MRNGLTAVNGDRPTNDDLGLMDNDSLMNEYRDVMAVIDPLVVRRKLIEFQIQRNMEADGATEFESGGDKAVLATKFAYDPDKLDGLYELVSPQELAAAGIVIPAHTVDVDREWRMTETRERKLGKRGTAVANLIAKTMTESRGKLKITLNKDEL